MALEVPLTGLGLQANGEHFAQIDEVESQKKGVNILEFTEEFLALNMTEAMKT